MLERKSISGANIIVPDLQAEAHEDVAVFQRLEKLKRDHLERGYHYRITVLITACIEAGIDTKPGIFQTMDKLEFVKKDVAAALVDCTGRDPIYCLWKRDLDGRYTLHPE